MGILAKIFENDAGPRVVDHILTHDNELLVHYQIERETGLSYVTVKRVLSELLDKGIIVRKNVGARKVYKLNKENPDVKKLGLLYHIE